MTLAYDGLIKEDWSSLKMLVFYNDRLVRLDGLRLAQRHQQGGQFQLWAVTATYGKEPPPVIFVVIADDATQAAETIEAVAHSPFYVDGLTVLSSNWFGQIHVEHRDLYGHSIPEYVVDKSQDEEALPVGSLVGPMGIFFHYVSEEAREYWARMPA